MIKRQTILWLITLLLSVNSLWAQTSENNSLPSGKSIYIPKDLQGMDLWDAESQWSYRRMTCTDNFVIFWEKGFGNDPSNSPQLEGHDMKVDLTNLKEKLEHFYHFFYHTLQFAKKGSKCDRYRMMVMLNYSLEGTAYGGDYDSEIGALWIAPNRVQDEKLNCIAHELGHSFQAQITCDGQGEAWGGCGFFEMTSQWMLWHVNPDWPTDEQYHWDAFCQNTHKAFLHLENIYRSPYVLEYWSEKHGLPFIAELFRQGKRGEDPAMTYQRLNHLTQEAFCDEMFDAVRRMVNLDFEHAFQETRAHAGQMATPLDSIGEGWLRPSAQHCPENYGFNVIPLPVPTQGRTVSIEFRGEAGAPGYTSIHADKAGWRYGVVATTPQGKISYGDMSREANGIVDYTAPTNEPPSRLWLVVMGAPTEHWMNVEGGTDAQWPYQIRISLR